jgi:hypothetical protein
MHGTIGYNAVACSLTNCHDTLDALVLENWTDMGGIAVAGGQVFYSLVKSGTSSIRVCPAGGPHSCTFPYPMTVVENVNARIGNLAADTNKVYFSESGGNILACPVTGCPDAGPTVLQTVGHVSGVAVDASQLYWADPVAGTISSCTLPDCTTATVVVTGVQHVNAITVDATNVYYAVGAPPEAGGTVNGVFWSPK